MEKGEKDSQAMASTSSATDLGENTEGMLLQGNTQPPETPQQIVQFAGGKFSQVDFGTHIDKRKIEGDVHVNIYKYESTKKPKTESDSEPDRTMLSDKIVLFPNKRISNTGNVFEGEEKTEISPRRLAIKLIPYDEKNMKEAKILTELNPHQHVVSIIQSDIWKMGPFKQIYIAMELCDAQNLENYVKDNNVPFDLELSHSFARQLVQGIEYIHSKEVIHRDLKPSNVLFSQDKKTLKIADFGLSKSLKKGRTVTKQTVKGTGTEGYRAPETYVSNVTSKRADIYSLGLVIYFISSNGYHAFGQDEFEWSSNIKNNKNRDLSNIMVPPEQGLEEALDLLEWMLRFEQRQRLTAGEILKHKYFGGKETSATLLAARPRTTGSDSGSSHEVAPKTREFDVLKDLANAHFKSGRYSVACNNLLLVLERQNDPIDKHDTLFNIAECQVRMNKLTEEINQMASNCKETQTSPCKIKSVAEENLERSNLVRAFIATVCASKLYAACNDLEKAMEGIASCLLELRKLAGKLTEDDTSKILKKYMIQALGEMLEEFRRIPVENDTKVVTEAWCLNRIGLCREFFLDYQKALEIYNEGVLVLQKQFGANATKYHVYGHLLINSGNMHLAIGDNLEAVKCMRQAITAFENAQDFPSDEEKKKVITSHKEVLESTEAQLK